MPDSLRVRLLAWYAALAMLVVLVVGGAVCWATWRSRASAIDDELRSRAGTLALAVRPAAGGGYDVELPSDATAYFQRPQARPYYAVWNGEGTLVDRSDPDVPVAQPPPGTRTRGSRRESIVRSRGLTILVGRDIADVRRELWTLAGTMALAAIAGMAVSLAGAWLLAGNALAPVQRINETARRMAEGDLTARIAVDRTESELGQVAFALNLAFDRQRESIERQRRFTADASHELRTPVAVMMAEIDWALRRERSSSEYVDSLATCRRAGARMQAMVEGLLTLARADSGELPVRRVDVRLDPIVEEVIESLTPLAASRGVSLRWTPSSATALGDPDRLRELLSNLIFNGITYSHAARDGSVDVDVRRDGDAVVLRVRDTGMGIAAADLPLIFDRFYRSDAARVREPAGAGLGLALVAWIVDAHGGSIACSSEVDRATEFVVRLPATQAAAGEGAVCLSARLAAPPSTPAPRMATVRPGVQMAPSPSSASSE
jgi:two-component system OmpR family sensor kinase